MKIKYPLVYCEWEDHHANGGWSEQADNTPAICVSVGWLVEEDNKGFTIASNLARDDNAMGNTQYVLKNCIVKRTLIRKAHAEKDAQTKVAPKKGTIPSTGGGTAPIQG